MESTRGQGDKDNPGSNGPILSLPISESTNLVLDDYNHHLKTQGPFPRTGYIFYVIIRSVDHGCPTHPTPSVLYERLQR